MLRLFLIFLGVTTDFSHFILKLTFCKGLARVLDRCSSELFRSKISFKNY